MTYGIVLYCLIGIGVGIKCLDYYQVSHWSAYRRQYKINIILGTLFSTIVWPILLGYLIVMIKGYMEKR